MKLLRTPDERFQNLPEFFFKPNYLKVEKIRIHYIDEGPTDGKIFLLMHGEPSWCYLYRYMIPLLVKAGYRVIAPDLVGFGRSDKPMEQSDHSYHKHIEWMTKWLKSLEIKDITLFCQDWGALIGLRVAIENQEKFSRIILSNGGLPTGEQRMSKAFLEWQEFSKTATKFDIKRIIQSATVKKLSKDVLKAYDAPFPDDRYKIGPRIMPSLVPTTINDPESDANKRAIEDFKKWEKPFLTAFSDKDPITRGTEKFWKENIPGGKGQKHVIVKDGGHFIQEDKGSELVDIILDFIESNP
jgi:haloalkane dehalogenase